MITTRHHPSAVDFFLSGLVFFVLGIFFRTSFYYLREGVLLFSALNAFIWSLVSTIVFVTIYKSLGFAKACFVGFAVYGIIFFVCFSYLFVAPNLTLKVEGEYVFQAGRITRHGILSYATLAVYDAAISVLCLYLIHRSKFR